MKLKAEEVKGSKNDSCLGCLGSESDLKCAEVSKLSGEQKLPMCERGFIYVEDKEIVINE
ncbi:MAG: hypothetical protein WBA74_10315 [Cyclobacteriaceae bacterium]